MAMEDEGNTVLPDSAAAGDDLVRSHLAAWDQGGREQLHAAFKSACANLQDNEPSPALVFLLRSLLASHIATPQLPLNDFQALFEAISPRREEAEASEEASSAGPSRHASATPMSSMAQAPILAPRFSDILLDVIWAVDAEIELRRDAAEAAQTDDGKGKDKEKVSSSADDEADAAKKTLADLVAGLVTSNHLGRIAVAERLDVSLLVVIGLVTDETEFNRKGVRINTANLYKQQKFNLLREENEGYSGLINEILGGMGPPILVLYDAPSLDEPRNWQTAPVKVVEQEGPADRNVRVRAVMRNISALIGYFDLDPNRVLDIILDLFSTNVTLHWPFFLALLWASPWARGRQRRAPAQKQQAGADDMAVDVDEPLDIIGIQIRIDEGPGNHTCAQLLGFKFDYYRLPDTREDVPNDLYTMSALLIQQGFVSFADLWPHLSPDEEGMKKLSTAYATALKDKAANARGNALTMAAPLADDEAGAKTDDDSKKAAEAAEAAAAAVKEPPNQVLGLLKALLSLGQLDYSLFILTLHPWLIGAFPEVADLFIRLLKEVIKPVYDSVSSASQHPVLSEELLNAPRTRYDVRQQALLPSAPPRLYATTLAPQPPSTATSRFVFAFGEGWKQQLPTCKSSSDLLETFVPLLRILGVSLHRDVELFQQICRLGRVQLKMADIDDDVKNAWLEIIRFHLFPALSLSSENSGLLNELWNLLRMLTHVERFSLYGEWKNELYKRPEVRFRQLETEKEAKGILKRISKENLKVSGRALAKASHANPLIFFTVALNQVQVYDNMIPHIVECAKYLTVLEYDVFSFNLIDALSNPEKERTKQDGQNISLWLKSLASFTGTLYRRYSMMNPIPVLQYICNQLKANNSKDLVIISELILKMSGIEPLANLADKQIAALSGGRLLRMEAMMVATAGPGTPARQSIRKTGARLMESLNESRLAVALLILIAQQRQVCVHLVPEPEAHLRYLSNLADNCQEVLFQYIEFLHSQLEPAAYADLIPSAKALCERFSIEPAIAFHIARPRLLHAMKMADDAEAEAKLRAELMASKARAAQAKKAEGSDGEDKEKDAEEKDGEVKKEDAGAQEDVEMAEVKQEDAAAGEEVKATASTPPATAPAPIWRNGLQEALETADAILSDEVKRVMGTHFFATFWQLSLADIQVPAERYEQEMRVVQRLLKEADTGGEKKSAAYLRHQESLDQLRAELKARTLAHQTTRRRLALEKDHWFPHNQGLTRTILAEQMIQHCLIPRALLSPTDAIFAGKIIRLMHLNGTRNFASLILYDRLFIEHVAPMIFTSTENEANSYARFLQVILDDLTAWYHSEELYAKEVIGSTNKLPGFQLRWQNRQGGTGEEIPTEALLSHEQFKSIMLKWHDNLRNAFKLCLTSGDFMRIRNAIAVMNRIAQRFPLFEQHGRDLIGVVEKLTKEETRGSLKVLGHGLLATLKKHQSEWQGKAKPKPKVEEKVAAPAAATAATPAEAAKKEEAGAAKEATPAAAEEGKSATPAAASSPAPPTGSSDTGTATKPAAANGSATTGRDQRSASASNAASPIPTGPSSDQRKSAGAQSQPPRGPSGASSNAGGNARSSNNANGPPARPGANLNRQSSQNSGTPQAPSRPSRDRDAHHAGGERLPPTGPRGSQGARNANSNNHDAASRDQRSQPAGSNRDDASTLAAARQAALGTMMNPPQAPASTPGAQAARDRGTGTPVAADRERGEQQQQQRGLDSADRQRTSSSRDDRDRDRDREPRRDRGDRGDYQSSSRDRDRDGGRDSRGPGSAAPSRGTSPSNSRSTRRRDGPTDVAVSSPRDPSPRPPSASGGGSGEVRDSGWGPRRERGEREREREREQYRDQRDSHSHRDSRDRDRDERRRGGGSGGSDDRRRSGRYDERDARDRSDRDRGDRDRDRDGGGGGGGRRSSSRPSQGQDSTAPAPAAAERQTAEEEATANAYSQRRRPDASRDRAPAAREPAPDEHPQQPRRSGGGGDTPTLPPPPHLQQRNRELFGGANNGPPASTMGPSAAAGGVPQRVWGEPQGTAPPSQGRGGEQQRGPAAASDRWPSGPRRSHDASAGDTSSSSSSMYPPRRDGPSSREAAEPAPAGNGSLKRSLADRLAGGPGDAMAGGGGGINASRGGSPMSPHNTSFAGGASAMDGGPDAKRARMNNSNGGGGSASGPSGGRSSTPTGPAPRGSNSPAVGPGAGGGGGGSGGPVRSVSISGSAARERERERREYEQRAGGDTQQQHQAQGQGQGQGHRGESRRRRGGGGGDRFKDRSRRRAGED